MGKLSRYLYKDKVFIIAVFFAILSMFFVVPNKKYIDYINFKVLIIMFTLMLSVAGFYETQFFDFIATKLVVRFRSIKWISMILIWTTFFLAMLLTNDAVLLTLVPFAIFILKHTNQEKYVVPLIILMTIAANMGSALTPMGDPQNIYLYAYYQIPFNDFIIAMVPITAVGFILVTFANLKLIKNEHCELNIKAPDIAFKKLGIYVLLLINALLAVLHIVSYWYTLGITLIISLIWCKHLMKRVDYTLLLTFLSFFIFTGNLSQMNVIKEMTSQLLSNDFSVYFMGLGVSQIISNVPSAVLLSTFTDSIFYRSLLQGVNVGSMGSIIGSLASLITFKYILKDYPTLTKKYWIQYSIISVIFIMIITLIILFVF